MIRDGRHWLGSSSAGAWLGLAINDLASSTGGLGRHHGSLWLSVRDDRDWHVRDSGSLWLTIGDLRDRHHGHGVHAGLNLPIGDLRDVAHSRHLDC